MNNHKTKIICLSEAENWDLNLVNDSMGERHDFSIAYNPDSLVRTKFTIMRRSPLHTVTNIRPD